jgi:ferric-dicitrate binding protein FerR (iron transport regulator)
MPERELDELFRAWRSESVPPSLPPSVDDRGGSAVVASALRRVAEQKRQKQRWRKLGAALALAAGLSGLGVGAWYELSGDSQLAAGAGSSVVVGSQVGDVAVTDGVGHVVEPTVALTEGYGLRTEQGSATLGFPSGASAKVAGKSSLKITAARTNEALFLARGSVDVEVPKLDVTRGFSVETPDARVTVHGTRFQVLVVPTADGPQTRVEVTRGIVSVQHAGHEVFLRAGQAWPPAAAQAAPAPSAAPAEADAGVVNGEPVPSGVEAVEERKHGARGAGPRHFDSRQLADQNARFARAMHLKKGGEPARALRELERIVRKYPGSPLAQECSVERLRLLASLGRTRQAAREAKRYLREFPDGYAVREARELLSDQQ